MGETEENGPWNGPWPQSGHSQTGWAQLQFGAAVRVLAGVGVGVGVGVRRGHFDFLTHFKFQLAINVMQSNTLNHCELANNANNANTNKPHGPMAD